MADANELMRAARERAEKIIDQAIGQLHAAAAQIGETCGIPENIAGHSIDELLGRMSYIPSMARDLRQACGQAIARKIMDDMLAGRIQANTPPPLAAPVPKAEKIEVSKIPGQVPVGRDIGDLSGVTVQAVKALKDAGFRTVGDVFAAPDEHLLKIPGIAEKSLAQVRSAIAKASGTV